jgi:hypothetical protein
MQEIDPRLVRIGIEVDGALKLYEDLQIMASGTKYANSLQNECEVSIANIDKATRDYILTETSPFNQNKKPKKLIVEAGRKSYGYTRIFVGDITNSNISQPPDITVKLKALTSNFSKGDVIARSQPAQTSLKNIAGQVAKDLGLSLDFQALDKSISNYSFSGGAYKQVDRLGDAGAVNAYVDDDVLIVKDWNVPLKSRTRILNLDSGMIGIPELTEQGIKVKFLLDNQTAIGSALDVTSKIYPTLNGQYAIYKLGFDIANRDTPFYYTAEAKRI